jgi:Rieske Fe-S protein
MSDHPDRRCGPDIALSQLTRREVMGAAAGLALASCSRAPKLETKKVAAKNGLVEIDIKDYPELATAGGMVALEPDGVRKPVLVMRVENEQFRVMSLKCPHLGCTVRWDPEMQDFVCPCHGSRFDDRGAVTKGPADTSLKQYRSQFLGMAGAQGGTILRFEVKE